MLSGRAWRTVGAVLAAGALGLWIWAGVGASQEASATDLDTAAAPQAGAGEQAQQRDALELSGPRPDRPVREPEVEAPAAVRSALDPEALRSPGSRGALQLRCARSGKPLAFATVRLLNGKRRRTLEADEHGLATWDEPASALDASSFELASRPRAYGAGEILDLSHDTDPPTLSVEVRPFVLVEVPGVDGMHARPLLEGGTFDVVGENLLLAGNLDREGESRLGRRTLEFGGRGKPWIARADVRITDDGILEERVVAEVDHAARLTVQLVVPGAENFRAGRRALLIQRTGLQAIELESSVDSEGRVDFERTPVGAVELRLTLAGLEFPATTLTLERNEHRRIELEGRFLDADAHPLVGVLHAVGEGLPAAESLPQTLHLKDATVARAARHSAREAELNWVVENEAYVGHFSIEDLPAGSWWGSLVSLPVPTAVLQRAASEAGWPVGELVREPIILEHATSLGLAFEAHTETGLERDVELRTPQLALVTVRDHDTSFLGNWPKLLASARGFEQPLHTERRGADQIGPFAGLGSDPESWPAPDGELSAPVGEYGLIHHRFEGRESTVPRVVVPGLYAMEFEMGDFESGQGARFEGR